MICWWYLTVDVKTLSWKFQFYEEYFPNILSRLSNAFIASLHINGLEMRPTPNQALLKCSSFSIIFSFDGVAFSLSFPKSLFSQNIRWKSSLDCFWRTFEVEYLGRSLVNFFIAWNRSNLMRMFVPNIKAATFSAISNSYQYRFL